MKNIFLEDSGMLLRSLIATALVFLLTAFHHYYGAVLYETPWRKNMVTHPGIVMLLCLLCVLLYKYTHRKLFLLLYLLVSGILFGLGVGIFEGLYNHVFKNVLFFSGMKPDTWRTFFPAPLYEPPNDFIFEVTGIAQFLLALPQLYYLIRLFKGHF